MNTLITTTATKKKLLLYRKEVKDELKEILQWWALNMVDKKQGGFFGSINNNNISNMNAAKSVVLNSRILWTFSSAYLFFQEKIYLDLAKRALEYIVHFFSDKEFGGVFWSVDAKGNMKEGKKQMYGIAFCIYALAEYYKTTGDVFALQFAKDLYEDIERYSFDAKNGGYIEAFTRDWKAADDLRLSEKDDNEKKTMNTHLHIVEAYANLYTAWPDIKLQEKIRSLLKIFDQYIINKNNYHLQLFLDDKWTVRSSLISFGHDIEAGWLLLACAEISGDQALSDLYKILAVKLTDAAAEGIDRTDGGLWYAYVPDLNKWEKEKHSWPQAEAMVGFFNAWQITNEDKYLKHSMGSFDFIKKQIKDKQHGEWFWGIEADGRVMKKEKAGFWKCPYHGTRACIEIYKRTSAFG
jgi:mannobiose 2-epimerase